MTSETKQILSNCETVTYLNSAVAHTFPDNLRTIAALAGFEATPATDCRVLEIGCALGRNLMPMAQVLPRSKFLGIDLSPGQIEIGNRELRQSALRNVELRCQDIMDFGASEGPFDYIIAHGIYSWVPAPVRERLFDIFANNLSVQGLAYVSYATLPGCHLRNAVRDMMMFHAREETDARKQVAKGREMGEILSQPTIGLPAYKAAMTAEIQQRLNTEDWLILHDEMAPVNHPVYVRDLVKEAASHELSYIADADPMREIFHLLPPAMQQRLQGFSRNEIELLQYTDFISGQTFRSSIFSRAGAARSSTTESTALVQMYVASNATREKVTLADGRTALRIKSAMTTNYVDVTDPRIVRVFELLNSAWPQAIHFPQLLEATAQIGGSVKPGGNYSSDLAYSLLKVFRLGLVELWTRPTDFIGSKSPTPRASTIVRILAAAGNMLVNRRHTPIGCDPLARQLLPLLDGTRNKEALQNELAEIFRRGEFKLDNVKGQMPSAAQLESVLDKLLTIIESNSLLEP